MMKMSLQMNPSFSSLKVSSCLLQIKEKLQEKTKGIRGAIVEDNKFCISVHFRCVDEEVELRFPVKKIKHRKVIGC
jgi:trehalose-6-phosphatase